MIKVHWNVDDPELQECACRLCETCTRGKGAKWSSRYDCIHNFKPTVDVHYGPDCHFYENKDIAERKHAIGVKMDEMNAKLKELYGKLFKSGISETEVEEIRADIKATWEDAKAMIKETWK